MFDRNTEWDPLRIHEISSFLESQKKIACFRPEKKTTCVSGDAKKKRGSVGKNSQKWASSFGYIHTLMQREYFK